MSDKYRDQELKDAHNAGQKHGSEGRSELTGGYYWDNDKTDAWTAGHKNGSDNQSDD